MGVTWWVSECNQKFMYLGFRLDGGAFFCFVFFKLISFGKSSKICLKKSTFTSKLLKWLKMLQYLWQASCGAMSSEEDWRVATQAIAAKKSKRRLTQLDRNTKLYCCQKVDRMTFDPKQGLSQITLLQILLDMLFYSLFRNTKSSIWLADVSQWIYADMMEWATCAL